MRCKPILLSGAIVLALSGGAMAQQGTPSTDQMNGSQPGAQSTAPADQAAPASDTETTKHQTMHHHYRHHMHHNTKTASLHSSSTSGEKRQTFDLNRQQLQANGSGGTPAGYMGGQSGMQSGGMQPGNAGYTQPMGTQTQGNQPGNASPEQPQNSPGEPGTSYMSAPGADGPVGAAGNPTTPSDQNGPGQNAQPANTNPGPSR